MTVVVAAGIELVAVADDAADEVLRRPTPLLLPVTVTFFTAVTVVGRWLAVGF